MEELAELFCTGSEEARRRDATMIFKHFDQDGDGVIDTFEFTTALGLLCHGTLADKAELIFNMYDFDKSKYIAEDELTMLLKNTLTALRCLSKKEPPTLEEIEAKTQGYFGEADVDGDNRIMLEEFKRFIIHDVESVECLVNYGIAKNEDLGLNFGDRVNRFYDEDLENEVTCPDSYQDEKRVRAKYGLDASEEQDQKTKTKYPWEEVAATLEPSNAEALVQEKVNPSLELEYIYGYRCHDSRNNLRYTAEGRMVYHTAGVGVVLSQRNNTQAFMLEHDDDILCLTTDAAGRYCATG